MRHRLHFNVFICVGALLVTGVASAQRLDERPGYVPLDALGIADRDALSVEINLQGPLLRLVAAAAGADDPEFARLVSGLEAIRVQVAPRAALGDRDVKARIDRTIRWLEDRGWSPTVRVRESGEESYIYVKEDRGEIVGLTVVALGSERSSDGELAIINIVGRLDPAQLGRLGRGFGLSQLERAPRRQGRRQGRQGRQGHQRRQGRRAVNAKALLPLLVLAAALGGCAGSPSIDQVRWEVERQVPGLRLEPETRVRLGRLTLGLVRRLAALDDDPEAAILGDIRRIDVAVYRVHGRPDFAALPDRDTLQSRLGRHGWSVVVKTREADERTWVFTRDDGSGSIAGLFVVGLDGEELALVHLDGRLDRLFAEKIASDPGRAARTFAAGD